MSKSDNNPLIAYFSHSGNTEKIATMIADKTGGTLFKVKTVTPYSDDYDECVEQAKKEKIDNARPALSTQVADISQYDILYIGFPNWWGTMPMAMFTFLEEYDLSGKTIIPFCTHEGSALGSSVSDIKALSPSSTVIEDGYACRGNKADTAKNDVEKSICIL